MLNTNSTRSARLILFVALTALLVVGYGSLAQSPSDAAFPVLTLHGTIQSQNASGIVLNGQIIDITGAQIDGALQVGMIVQVEAFAQPDGLLRARRVTPQSVAVLPGFVMIEGVISATPANSIVIGTQTLDMSSAAVAEALASGMTVRAFAVQTAPNQWRALSVLRIGGGDVAAPIVTPEVVAPLSTPEIAAPVTTPEIAAPVTTPEVSDDFRIEGVISALGNGFITVNGQTINVQSARIEGALAVGVAVRVEARIINGAIVAEEVEREDD